MGCLQVLLLLHLSTVALAAAAAAAAPATAPRLQAPPTLPTVDLEEALLLADDACVEGGAETCALSALQARGRRLVSSHLASPAPGPSLETPPPMPSSPPPDPHVVALPVAEAAPVAPDGKVPSAPALLPASASASGAEAHQLAPSSLTQPRVPPGATPSIAPAGPPLATFAARKKVPALDLAGRGSSDAGRGGDQARVPPSIPSSTAPQGLTPAALPSRTKDPAVDLVVSDGGGAPLRRLLAGPALLASREVARVRAEAFSFRRKHGAAPAFFLAMSLAMLMLCVGACLACFSMRPQAGRKQGKTSRDSDDGGASADGMLEASTEDVPVGSGRPPPALPPFIRQTVQGSRRADTQRSGCC
mmetsp:Transcript_38164/g.109522  ORF Transcript_38164/g.109522 Transcript_38164/m.109522 type:complete len:361 (+) Transcript_38164:98-1180(+)